MNVRIALAQLKVFCLTLYGLLFPSKQKEITKRSKLIMRHAMSSGEEE